MKNRKGTTEFRLMVVVVGIIAALLYASHDAKRYDIEHARQENIICIQTLNLIPTLKDTVKFYHIHPECVNATPKDTVHG
jgi:hypothetical protein